MLVAVSSAAATVLIALMSPVLARVLQPEGRGELAAAQTALALSPVLIAFGTKELRGLGGDPWRLGRLLTARWWAWSEGASLRWLRRSRARAWWPSSSIGVTPPSGDALGPRCRELYARAS